MMPQQQPPWKRYQVGEPARGSGFNPSCKPLNIVNHVCHIADAFGVIRDGRIKSGLIGDESRLKTTRTSVTWVSPNDWHYGSRYGNICFEFRWERIIQEKHFYWVEVMTNYSPHAYRILVTQNDYTSYGLLPYDFNSADGPLYFDGSNWWWNNNDLCSEFMFDSDLSLNNCTRISFVKHHDTLCGRDGGRCVYRGMSGTSAGEEFLTNLIGRNDQNINQLLIDQESGYFHSSVEQIIALLLHGNFPFVRRMNSQVSPRSVQEIEAFTRAIYLAYGNRNNDLATQLALLLQNRAAFLTASRNIIEQHFGITVGDSR